MNQIKFGTDGWRAIMGQEFTPENVTRVIQAFCEVNALEKNRKIFVGFDRRQDSEKFAHLVAAILATHDFEPSLASTFCPTPCVSWMTKTHKALAAVMITASHNPPEYNGIKFKESYGGAASPAFTDRIEKAIGDQSETDPDLKKFDYNHAVTSGKIKYFDPHDEYVQHLKKFVNVDLISKEQFKIAIDSMYGAGAGYFQKILSFPIASLHQESDPHFGGMHPEPIEKNLFPLRKKIAAEKLHVGLATDGDADRIGAMDENGEYVDAHQIFALLLLHHLEYRKLRGPVIKSVSTTQWIDRIGKKFGVEVIETPIGFRHICKVLHERDALMGGEESGGISLREHVHERDGVLNGLLLLEMMAVRGQKLSELVKMLRHEFGNAYFARRDYKLTSTGMQDVTAKLAALMPADVDVGRVSGISRMDGVKILFSDDSWLLLRASGTEPLLRVYAEASSPGQVNVLQDWAALWLQISL